VSLVVWCAAAAFACGNSSAPKEQPAVTEEVTADRLMPLLAVAMRHHDLAFVDKLIIPRSAFTTCDSESEFAERRRALSDEIVRLATKYDQEGSSSANKDVRHYRAGDKLLGCALGRDRDQVTVDLSFASPGAPASNVALVTGGRTVLYLLRDGGGFYIYKTANATK